MKCPTYKLMLTNSLAGISDEERTRIEKILDTVSKNDYCFTIEWTPLSDICKYTLSIIVLRRSKEEAEPVTKVIEELLNTNGFRAERFSTILLWDEEAKRYASYIN